MKIFEVGGCVRDRLLGLIPKDIDYVVTESSPSEMLALGYVQVGKDFPVFLKDGAEYALARTERKVGVGYNGFQVTTADVELTQDLLRRDLTINAMARCIGTGEIIDPYGGQSDLKLGILRHTSFAFAEDPIRVLRCSRFAARYSFTIDPSTMMLMKVVAHELNHVSSDRIWDEVQKGLLEPSYMLMFEALGECGTFDNCELLRPLKRHSTNSVNSDSPICRFVGLLRDVQPDLAWLSTLRVPTEYVSVYTQAWHIKTNAHTWTDNISVVDFIIRSRSLSRPQFIEDCLTVAVECGMITHTQCDSMVSAIRHIRSTVNMQEVSARAMKAGRSVKDDIRASMVIALQDK